MKLALPFNALPTSSELLGDTLPPPIPPSLANPLQQLYPWVTQAPSAPPPLYAFPVMSLAGGEIRGPQGQKGTVIGGFADVVRITPEAVGQPLTVQPRVLQPMGVGGTTGAAAKAGG